jgi:glutathione S-transferase
MIVVHHLNNSRSQRILWLLEELGTAYEIRKYQRNPLTLQAPPELRAIHPLGKSPVIVDGTTTVAESAVIIEYLLRRYGQGRLRPVTGTPERLRYVYWMHYAEGSAMPPLLLALVFNQLPQRPMPFIARPIVKSLADKAMQTFIGPQLRTHLDFMEGELGESPWFAGEEFSAADIQMSFPVEAFRARGGLDERWPRLMAWLERIHARPAYQRALDAGGAYELLK